MSKPLPPARVAPPPAQPEPAPVEATDVVIHAVPIDDLANDRDALVPLHERLAELASDRNISRSPAGPHISGVLSALSDLRHRAQTAIAETQDDDVRAVMISIMDL